MLLSGSTNHIDARCRLTRLYSIIALITIPQTVRLRSTRLGCGGGSRLQCSVAVAGNDLRQWGDMQSEIRNQGRGSIGRPERGSGDVSTPDRDEIFTVLSNERRRYALQYLKNHDDEAVDLGDLVDYIAARENDTTVAALDYKQRKRVYSSLRQTHLPTLSDCNVIDYEEDRGTITLNGAAREVQMYLEYVPKHDIPWCYHYLGLAIVLGGIGALTWASVYPFGGLSGLALAAITTAVFGISAVVHTAYTKRNTLGSELELER